MTPKQYERFYIEKILEQVDWVIKGPNGAAAPLGMPYVGQALIYPKICRHLE